MECPGVIHCFSGSLEQARNLMNMGFYLGVNGMFTKMDEDAELCMALKSIPLEKVVLETDSPYYIKLQTSRKVKHCLPDMQGIYMMFTIWVIHG